MASELRRGGETVRNIESQQETSNRPLLSFKHVVTVRMVNPSSAVVRHVCGM